MVDIFYNEICQYCKNINNNSCNQKINIYNEKSVTIYNCDNYIKNDLKIKGYETPLLVTAERDYISLKEV